MLKKLSMFLFAVGLSASYAWAIPDDGGAWLCQQSCNRSYQQCQTAHCPNCQDNYYACLDNCPS
jgi:hypothetical protein